MYTPKEWKNTPKDWSSTLDSWICKENMFWNILHLSKSDFKRSRIINPPTPPHPLSFLGFCHGNVFDDEWPAHKSVSVKKRKKKITWTFGKTEMLLLVLSQSVEMNGHRYASLLKKLFPCCEVSPHSNFPVVWFVTTFLFLNCVALFSCKENSPSRVNDYQWNVSTPWDISYHLKNGSKLFVS